MLSIFFRGGVGFRFHRRRDRNDQSDFVFLDEDISIVGLDFVHTVFNGDDRAVKFLAVLQANFVGTHRAGER